MTIALRTPVAASRSRALSGFLFLFLIAGAASLATLHWAGPLQGVLFGSCIVAALTTPPMCAGTGQVGSVGVSSIAIFLGVSAGPIAAMVFCGTPAAVIFPALTVIGSIVVCIAGLAGILSLARIPSAIATLILILLLLAWLGWPVWLSPWLPGNQGVVDILTPAHPLLAIDAILTRAGGAPWIEQRLMYGQLTNLGQHVYHHPPTGIFWAVLLHGGIGVGGIVVSRIPSLRNRTPSIEPNARAGQITISTPADPRRP